MDERIKLLAEQADILITEVGAFHNTPAGAFQLKEQHITKFAELIVRECADVGFNAAYPDKGVVVLTAIKEHFGVEL